MYLHPHRRDAERAEEAQRVVVRFRASRNNTKLSAPPLRTRRLGGNVLLSVKRAFDLAGISSGKGFSRHICKSWIRASVRL